MKIYYLDDEVALCEIFKEFVADDQTNVMTFSCTNAFINECKLNPPDLAFIDYRLTDTSGDRVALQIEPSIPKVMVTGELDTPTTDLFIKVIPKPYKLDNIKQIIERIRTTGLISRT